MPDESKKQRLYRLGAQLKQERDSFDAHYRELGEYYFPRRTRFFDQDRNRGDKRNQKIINCTGPLAARTLRSGMMAGITSPARPWRRLTTPDPDLAEFGRVKQWLDVVNRRMTTLSLRSNLFNALPTMYGDAGVFATAAMGVDDDDDDLMRFYTFPVGSYWLATDARGVTNTFMREFQMTVRQLVEKFGNLEAGPDRRWANFSLTVQQAWDLGNYETPISVVWIVAPNPDYRSDRLEAKYKRFTSCYFEQGAGGMTGLSALADLTSLSDDRFLRESGYDRFPILAPRWDVTGEDTYGTACPGMDGLGDVKEVQLLEKRKSRALEKQLNPPLKGPTSLRTQKASLLAGDITYVDEREGQGGLKPIHETTMSIKDVTADIKEKEHRIQRVFYEDLFLMLAQSDRREITAREIDERHEEKLLALGQVLERMNDELLDPLTDIQFDKMLAAGLIPPAPDELRGMDLKVEYISIMAQAQKLVGAAGTERFVSFVGNMAGAFPQVLKKVNAFQVVDEYADMMGVSAKLVVSDDDAMAVQQQEDEAKAAILKGELALKAAEGAKTMSETSLEGDNALARAVGVA